VHRSWADTARRGLTEFVVIVVGVLAALWIDAGWSWLQDRDEEHLILADLASDFQANLATLDQTIAVHDDQLRAVERGLTNDVASIPMDELLPMTRAVFTLETFLPRRGALDAAISSGRVTLIRDHALRSELAGWERLVAEASEEIDFAWPLNVRLLEHLAGGEILFLPITTDQAHQPLADSAVARRLMRQVFSDPTARALLKTKSMFVVEARPDFLTLRAETERIRDMILAH
jgi:hypothetical protein